MKYSIFLFLSFLSFNLSAQALFHSLDAASPPFSKEERAFLLSHGGVYFIDSDVTQFYGGNYFSSDTIVLGSYQKRNRTYYQGINSLYSWEYLSLIGMTDESIRLQKYVSRKKLEYPGYFMLGGGIGSILAGFMGLSVSGVGTITIGSFVLGALLSIGGAGIILSIPDNPNIADSLILQKSTDYNRRLLEAYAP